ncbi:MAG: tRNA (adenosine(37)-N6)-threonylcarbamoyltransferase complex ATPase subunit type 1 TsaE [Gemmatimonadaceae bacterium]
MRVHHHVVPPLAASGKVALTEPELRAWGEELGRSSRTPLVIAISGELGAGKTTLAQAISRGAGVQAVVTSPTFALVQRYDGARSPVYHLDLYRLESPRDLQNIGWDDVLREDALVLVEWPERANGLIPDDALHLELEYHPTDATRRVLLAG